MLTRRTNRIFPEFSLLPEVGQIVDSFLSAAPAGVTAVFPPLNVWEDNDNFHVEAELPGYAMSNIDISMTGSELTIAGTRDETLPENATLHRAERSTESTKFTRTIRIGAPIQTEAVSAKFDAGVLTVTLPKAAEAKPRRIQVKVN